MNWGDFCRKLRSLASVAFIACLSSRGQYCGRIHASGRSLRLPPLRKCLSLLRGTASAEREQDEGPRLGCCLAKCNFISVGSRDLGWHQPADALPRQMLRWDEVERQQHALYIGGGNKLSLIVKHRQPLAVPAIKELIKIPVDRTAHGYEYLFHTRTGIRLERLLRALQLRVFNTQLRPLVGGEHPLSLLRQCTGATLHCARQR